ncbi:hypothetical protein [Micromonospora sp. NPDC005652]|uniref:hypothetical protein n=1 Tax=Micromonospora sp. NPDC005652 TaxID=3157046 RepID=UPI0033CBE570
MDFLNDPLALATGVGVAIALHVLGVKVLAEKTGQSKLALWAAFVTEAIAGLILGVALFQAVRWLTGLSGGGAVLGAIGSIIALTLGWQAVKMLVAMIRDLADGQPDKEARRAALWVPTLIPAGWAAVTGLVSNPRGIGGGIVAAIQAAITLAYTLSIVKETIKAKKHQVPWRWFAAAVCTLAGLVLIAAVIYIDGLLADYLSAGVMVAVRLIGGAVGLGFAIAALADISDGVPGAHVRKFAVYGLPLLYLFGSAIIAWASKNASSGLDLISGNMS